jgi:DNA-binding NarL/FixJ family response regulator
MLKSLEELTPRQREIVDLICQGLTTRLIAEKLHMSPYTVSDHRHVILQRLGVNNSAELVNKVNELKQKSLPPSPPGLAAKLAELPELIVVEDDEDYRELVLSILQQSGFPCRAAWSLATLEAAMAERPAQIVILDLNLGQEDGLDIARRLRDTWGLGVIMMTTRGMVDQRLDGLAMGADAYLVKPVDMRELISVIRNLHRRLVEARFAAAR